MTHKLPALLAILCLTGCGGTDEEGSRPVDEGVFDDMTGTMDRAEGTEQQLLDAADARRRALEEQEN